MKITRLKLTNFIGIKSGLDLDELELDFTKGSNNIIMLRGENGSGKTTILRQLNPFKGNKSDYIIDGLDGRKEIDITDGSHTYEIVHVYSKAGQSFIKKDGVELNPNGGLGTFMQLLKSELGVDESYKSIGSVGNNASSFIDMKPTDRKAYIADLIGTEEYDEAFEIVNEKSKELKKDLKKVGDELKKFSDQKVVEDEIKKLEKTISEVEKEMSELYGKQGSLSTEIKHNIEDIGTNTVNATQAKINEKNTIISTNTNIRDGLLNELDDIAAIKDDNDAKNFAKARADSISEDISQLITQLEVNETNKTNITTLITNYRNKIKSSQISISSLGDPDKIEKLQKEIERLTPIQNKIAQEVKSIGGDNPAIVNRNRGIPYINTSIQKFIDFTDFLEKYYTDLSSCRISPNRSNISYFFENDFTDSLERQITESRNIIKSKKDLLEAYKKELATKESNICQLDNLKKRPCECTIDDCPFIKEALKHKNVLEEIADVSNKLESVKKDLEILEVKADNLEGIKTLHLNFIDAYTRVQPRDNVVLAYFLNKKTLKEWIEGPLSEFQSYRQEVVDYTNHGLDIMKEFLDNKLVLDSIIKEKENLESTDSAVRLKYEDDIKDAEKGLASAEEALSKLSEEGKLLSDQLATKQSLKKKYNDFADATSQMLSAKTSLYDAKTLLEKLIALENSKNLAQQELSSVNNRLQQLSEKKRIATSSLVVLQTALENIKTLTEKLNKLNSSYGPVELIRDSLDSKSGIPLILITTYLSETEEIINRLLDVAFNGKFKIKFYTDAREFSIRIYTGDEVKSDISVASQGETAIVTISLCLALIQQSLKRYNIVCLDEIDGALDKKNRQNFINILNSQINSIGIEQVFVISHNDAFDTADVDLILLKDHGVDTTNAGFMKNKTILYEFN